MLRRFLTTGVRHHSNFEEKQYLRLVSKIIDDGNILHGRNGNVYSSIGESMRFSLKNNTIYQIKKKFLI